MDRNKELEVVTSAFFLEANINLLQKNKQELQSQMPKKPEEPKLIEVTLGTPQYPTIDTSHITMPTLWKTILIVCAVLFFISFPMANENTVFLVVFLLAPLFLIGILTALILGTKAKNEAKDKYKQKIMSSPEYINKCRQIDEESRIEYERLKEDTQNAYTRNLEKYNVSLKDYNENLLPQWEEEYKALEIALSDTNAALRELYGTNIIPGECRNLNAVSYLAAYLSTSQFDLGYAIERYNDKKRDTLLKENNDLQRAQILIMTEIRQNQEYANYLNEQYLYLTEASNETLRSISNWQKADIAMRTYERIKERRNAKR